jgi:hypothetical protein
VKGALHLAAFHPAVREGRILVGAGVVQCEQLAILRVKDGDRWGRVETKGVSGSQCGEGAGDVHLINLFPS